MDDNTYRRMGLCLLLLAEIAGDLELVAFIDRLEREQTVGPNLTAPTRKTAR